jgi:uncharacterized membrane protein YkvA (DUF1232 family)
MTNAEPYQSPHPAPAAAPTNSIAGTIVSIIGLLLAGVYLANPTAGIDLIPDFLPGIGNIDEVVATTIFLACLSRLGINILPQGPRKTVVESHVVKD